ILISHVKCAAFEMPFVEGETFGVENLREMLDYLCEEKVLHRGADGWHWAMDVYPADTVSLRSVSTENFVIMDMTSNNRVIAEVDYRSAPTTVYQDAIYMCETEPYHVRHIDYEQRRVYVKKVEVDYYTEAITNTSVKILEVFETQRAVEHGDVHVAWRVSGFKKLKFHTRENVGYGEVNLPDQEMHTTSYWFTIAPSLLRSLPFTRAEILDGVAGLAYVLHHVAPLHLMCDVGDLQHCVGDRGGRWFVGGNRDHRGRLELAPGEAQPDAFFEQGMRTTTPAAQRAREADALERMEVFEPTVFLYDNYPGGIGFSATLYDLHATLVAHARDILQACGCEEGCPSCVGPIVEMGRRAKEVARVLADSLLERP
ncbi:MAG: DUF1998 domain-containing protein, partial [Armatimonadetes bacterium]|nr:DUF1998 domain-containing protein [Armatimonadota bacterium]